MSKFSLKSHKNQFKHLLKMVLNFENHMENYANMKDMLSKEDK